MFKNAVCNTSAKMGVHENAMPPSTPNKGHVRIDVSAIELVILEIANLVLY